MIKTSFWPAWLVTDLLRMAESISVCSSECHNPRRLHIDSANVNTYLQIIFSCLKLVTFEPDVSFSLSNLRINLGGNSFRDQSGVSCLHAVL